jgi:predicted ester cyclase
MVAEGDKVFVRATMQGIQRAEFLGIPSKGKPMLVPVADVLRFENGRIVEHWGVMDTGQMMEQLL